MGSDKKDTNKQVSLFLHKFIDPLTNIKWLSSMLLNDNFGSLSEEQKKAIEKISNTNKKMIELVDLLVSNSEIKDDKMIIDLKEQFK